MVGELIHSLFLRAIQVPREKGKKLSPPKTRGLVMSFPFSGYGFRVQVLTLPKASHGQSRVSRLEGVDEAHGAQRQREAPRNRRESDTTPTLGYAKVNRVRPRYGILILLFASSCFNLSHWYSVKCILSLPQTRQTLVFAVYEP